MSRENMNPYKMYINGDWVQSSSEENFKVINPATEEAIVEVPSGTADDAKRALVAAQESQRDWEDLAPLERAKFLYRIAELIEENREHLAQVVTSEQGKPLYEARLEIDGSAANFRYYAEFARRIEGDVLPSDNRRQSILILRLPLGVVSAITPWNFPSATIARKIAPALITGNTIVVKPSSYTPLSAIEIARIAEKAELPRGVLNVVTGEGSVVGNELVTNNIAQLVTMTGSTDSGQKIMKAASNHVPKLILELGGKAPFIVWDDADISWAVRCAVWARFWNNGQTCICSERIYLSDKTADIFLDRFVKAVKELKFGDPISAETDLGPRASRSELESGERFVQKAIEEGGEVILGGKRPEHIRRGYYYEPTIIKDVAQDSTLMQEEIFGPIVPIMEVDDFDRAIELANDSKYGLASYVFTRDNSRVMKAMHKIKFGECYINTVGPEQLQGAHTGFRMSGVGTEGSRYCLECYTQLKTCYVDWNDTPSISHLFPYRGRHA